MKLVKTTFVYGENLLTENKKKKKITDEADVLQISIDLTKKSHNKVFFSPFNIFISHLIFFTACCLQEKKLFAFLISIHAVFIP
jgi:hypothetical protein